MSEELDRATEEVIRELSREADQPMDVDPHDDRTRTFGPSVLSRMVTRGGPNPETERVLEQLGDLADREILKQFGNAYQLMNDLYGIVRAPLIHPETHEVLRDLYGFPLWERTESGYPIEEWDRLGYKERQDFLFRITTNLFAWEQAAATMRGNSQYLKAVWERALAQGYQDSRASGGKTVEDRTQAARMSSTDERLEGIFYTILSHRADALVRSLSLLGQRLKDVLSA